MANKTMNNNALSSVESRLPGDAFRCQRPRCRYSGAPARAKRAWDNAPYSWNMVKLFSFGCHAIDQAYVRTRLQIVRVG